MLKKVVKNFLKAFFATEGTYPSPLCLNQLCSKSTLLLYQQRVSGSVNKITRQVSSRHRIAAAITESFSGGHCALGMTSRMTLARSRRPARRASPCTHEKCRCQNASVNCVPAALVSGHFELFLFTFFALFGLSCA